MAIPTVVEHIRSSCEFGLAYVAHKQGPIIIIILCYTDLNSNSKILMTSQVRVQLITVSHVKPNISYVRLSCGWVGVLTTQPAETVSWLGLTIFTPVTIT